MIFLITLAVLFVISFLWALLSLKKELSKPSEIKKAEREFKKEKILYIR